MSHTIEHVDSVAEHPTGCGTQQLTTQRVVKVWLLTNAPSPYQSELLSAISDRGDIDLHVRFLQSGSPAGRASAARYQSRVLGSIMPRGVAAELQFHPRAVWECATGRSDCYVLSGLYTSVTFLLCACVLSLRRSVWVVWFERPRPDDRRQANWTLRWLLSRPLRGMRNLVRTLVLRSTHRLICIGTAARDEYASRGMPEHLMDILPYCCETNRYATVNPQAVTAVKERFGLAGQTVYLFSGQLIERKGVDVAVSAFHSLASEREDVAMLILGDGPRRKDYESLVPNALRNRVHFVGHVPQHELPALFAAADVFVFPSRHDGWGVVINEACAAGLPVITTRQTGAARDLVEHGKSGFILQKDDVDGFASAMRHFVDQPEDRIAFGQRSRELVEPFSPENGARRFQRAVAAACRT